MIPLKNQSVTAMVIAVALLASCETDNLAEIELVTSAISKIETEYYEGAVKIENYTVEKKETALSEFEINKLYSTIYHESRDYVENKKAYSPTGRTDFGGYDVGVLPYSGVCPIGFEQIEFFMDCEDGSPITKIDPFTGQNGITRDSNYNLRYKFCRVDGRRFYPFSVSGDPNFSFGLLKLGNLVPDHAIGYTHNLDRYFDNEDSNNKNSYIGDIAPNAMNRYGTTFRFLVMQSSSSYTGGGGPGYQRGLPDLGMDGQEYGVFTIPYTMPSGAGSMGDYEVLSDDEDSGNANWARLDGANYLNTYPWLTAGGNTRMRFVYHLFF